MTKATARWEALSSSLVIGNVRVPAPMLSGLPNSDNVQSGGPSLLALTYGADGLALPVGVLSRATVFIWDPPNLGLWALRRHDQVTTVQDLTRTGRARALRRPVRITQGDGDRLFSALTGALSDRAEVIVVVEDTAGVAKDLAEHWIPQATQDLIAARPGRVTSAAETPQLTKTA